MPRQPKILIIDDDRALRRAAARILTKAGYQVTEAATGREGLQARLEAAPDVVLLDVVLPDIGGLEVCRRIKRSSSEILPQVILISGRAVDSEARAAGLEVGADAYLARPISNRELAAQVAAAVRTQTALSSLRHERERVARISETSPVGITVVHRAGRIVFANARAEAILGLTAAETEGRAYNDPAWHITDYDGGPFLDEDLPFTRVMATRAPVHGVRHAIQWPNGQRVLLSVSGAPIFDGQGEVIEAVFAVQDVTAEVRDTRQMARLNAVLRAIRDVNQLLVRASEREELACRVCEVLVRSGVYHGAWIAFGDGAQQLRLAAEAGRVAAGDVAPCLRVDPPPQCLSEALTTGRVWHCRDHQAVVDRCPVLWTQVEDEVLVAPLIHGTTRYGVLAVAVDPVFAADPESETLLEEVAGDVAYALRGLETAAKVVATSAQLAEQAAQERRFQDRMQALVEVSNVLVGTASVDELCRRAVSLAQRRLGFERIGIWLREPDDPEHFHGTFGIDERGKVRDERHRVIDIEPEVIAWAARGASPPIITDQGALYDDRSHVVGQGPWMRALLWDGDAFAGMVSVDRHLSGEPLSERDADLLTLYASTLSNLIFRKRAETKLEAREAFYRTIFQNTGTAMLVVNADTSVALANEECERLLGYTADQLQREVQGVSDLIEPNRVEVALGHHRARRQGDPAVPTRFESQALDRAGNVRDVVVQVRMIPGSDQSVVSLLDITDQKEAVAQAERHAAWQQALNEVIVAATQAGDLQELLDAVLAQTLLALDVDGGACWILWRRKVQAMPGPFLETLIGTPVPAAGMGAPIRVDDWAEVSEPWLAEVASAALEAGFGAGLALSLDGPEQDGALSGLVVVADAPRAWRDGEVAFFSAVCRQLIAAGERLDLLAQVRRQARSLQLVIDTVPEGVVLLTAEGAVLLANPLARRYLDVLNATDTRRVVALGDHSLDEVLTPQPESRWHEVKVRERVFEVAAGPVAEVDSLQGWVMMLRDVTDARRIERELRRQERLAAVGQLAAGIAHDFNNIMAVIMLYAQMAEQEAASEGRTRDQLRVIREQARRATDLIRQILDFSRSAPLERRRLELLPYLKEIIKLWNRTLPESIEIDFVYERGDYVISGDATRLQQAFMNIATNARDAMTGGGRFEVRLCSLTVDAQGGATLQDGTCADRQGELPALASGGWIRIDFADTGTGISPELMSRVFQPFFTTKERGRGTGLGLAQIYGIVKQHEGEVVLDSEVGVGTTVSIYLPSLDEYELAPDAEPIVQASATGAGELVLVVEDSATTRAVLVDAVELLGYGVVEAATGQDALSVLDTMGDEIRVILSDAVMPVMGGAELMTTLAERGDAHPFVMLSGYLGADDQAGVRDLPNFVAWLSKPVELHVLAQTLRTALQR